MDKAEPIAFDRALKERILQGLAAFEPLDPPAPNTKQATKQAAVAIVIAPGKTGAAQFLLTRRAPKLSSHAGQWALPGGRLDAGETVEEAALRELHEEIGLALDAGAVLGALDAYPTRSGYAITPVVVWAEEASNLALNPAEVASVHRYDLAELRRPDSPVFLEIEESERPVIRVLLGERHVHAPTAALLYQFAEVGLAGRMTRVHELEQPVFAWK